MQVLAGIPAELVDVIQAIILLFLAADIVVPPSVPASGPQARHRRRLRR